MKYKTWRIKNDILEIKFDRDVFEALLEEWKEFTEKSNAPEIVIVLDREENTITS